MRKSSKVFCLLFAVLMLFTLSITAFAGNETNDGNIKIEVATNKGSYGATGVAEITATITNVSGEDINNVTAQAVFNDLAPAGKRTSETSKSVDILKSGESFSFTYKATLNKDQHKLNIFQKIILFFVRLFNGGYNANNNNIDVAIECVTDITFGKFTAENVVQVGYDKEIITIKDFDFYFKATPFDIVVGKKTEVIFTAEYQLNYNSNIKPYVQDEHGNFITYLYDNGENGDKKANDNIFSANYELYSDTEKFVNYYVLCDGVVSSYAEEIFYYTPFTQNELEESENFEKKLDEVQFKYINGNGYVNDSDIDNYLSSVCDLCYQNSKIVKYYNYDKKNQSVYIELYSGMTYLIVPPVEGRLAGGGPKEIITFEPNKTSIQAYLAKIFMGIANMEYESVSDTANKIKSYSNNFVYDNKNSLEDSEVTIDALKNITSFGVLIWNGHGGYSEENNVVALMTASKVTKDYNSKFASDIKAKRIVKSSGISKNYGITSKFIDEYFPILNESIVYLGACYSCANDSFANSFLRKGASSVYGYNVSVAPDVEVQLRTRLFTSLCTYEEETKQYRTVQEAYEMYKTDNEKFGFIITTKNRNAHLLDFDIISGKVIDKITNNPISNVTIKCDEIGVHCTTDENGIFRFYLPLPRKAHTFSFSHSLYNDIRITVTANSYSMLDTVELSTSTSTLTGTVLEESTEIPINGVTVCFTSNNNSLTTTTDENGRFNIKVPVGEYKITVCDTATHYCNESRTITVKENEEIILSPAFYMKQGTKVTGKVVDKETKTPLSGITLEVFDITDLFIVQKSDGDGLYYYDDLKERAELVTTVTTDKNGEYFFNAPVGDYVITVNHENYKYYDTAFSLEFGLDEYFVNDISLVTKGAGDDDRPITASGECGASGDNVTWILYEDGELVISGSGAMEDYSHSGDVPWYSSYNESIIKVTIKDGITHIGDFAFYWCTVLEDIFISNSIKTIGDYVFYNCVSLISITVDKDNQNYSSAEGVLFNKEETTLIQYPAANSRKSYIIPDSVITIGNFAFKSCDSLTSVTIPNSVTNIGNSAFYYCSSLTNITISDSVMSIGGYAFSGCTSLETIAIGDSVTSIGDSAFYNCKSLTSITVDEDNRNYSSADGVLFNKEKTTLIQHPVDNGRKSYIIPDSVTTIRDGAFGATRS